MGLLAPVAYPNGIAQPSITGRLIIVYRGWPPQPALQADIGRGTSCVSIYARPRASRNTTRYPQAWQQASAGIATITATVNGWSVTFGGTATAEQNVGVAVNGVGHVYSASPTDTPQTIASALAAMIPGSSATGPVLLCPAPPLARVEAFAGAIREMRRQEQQVQVTVWSPTFTDRDTIAGALDAAMSAIDFMPLSDGQQARVRYHDTGSSDAAENATLYRRDLTFIVEYATTQTAQQPTVVFPSGVLNGQTTFGPYGVTWDTWVPDQEPIV